MNGLAVSLRGRARYSAQRRSPFSAGVNEGGTTQALLRPLGRERLFYFGGKDMNFGAEMMPGITLLAAGAFLGFFADGVCKNKKNVQPMRLLGTFLAFAGAILVFIS